MLLATALQYTRDKNLNEAILILPSVMDVKRDYWCLHLLFFVFQKEL